MAYLKNEKHFLMKARILLIIASCLLAVCFTSYAQDYPKVLDDYIQSRIKDAKTIVIRVEKTGENTYSGIYCVQKDRLLLFTYQFFAFIKGGQVKEFSEITDDNIVLVITFDEESSIKAINSDFSSMPKYTIETKAEYDARMRREKR